MREQSWKSGLFYMDNKTGAQGWLNLAVMDMRRAEYLTTMKPVPVEIICYYCHQSVEKYLKGYLVLNFTITSKYKT